MGLRVVIQPLAERPTQAFHSFAVKRPIRASCKTKPPAPQAVHFVLFRTQASLFSFRVMLLFL